MALESRKAIQGLTSRISDIISNSLWNKKYFIIFIEICSFTTHSKDSDFPDYFVERWEETILFTYCTEKT